MAGRLRQRKRKYAIVKKCLERNNGRFAYELLKYKYRPVITKTLEMVEGGQTDQQVGRDIMVSTLVNYLIDVTTKLVVAGGYNFAQ